jgi:hypothetical protein
MKILLSFCALVFVLNGFGQAAEQAAAISRLQFLEGVWKGKGWIQPDEKKQYFNETETASIKLGGTLLQIDVFGTSVDDDSLIINNGLAIVRYNVNANRFEMQFFQSDGSSAEAILTLKNKYTVQIDLHRGSSFTRFVIEARDKRWFEKAFTSSDGKNWRQFFEMNLTRQ